MAQLVLFTSRTIVDFIQNKVILHISTRINVALINDYLTKLMRLPLGFFDTKMTGNLMQRIGDHHRIEEFLTGSTLRVLFSAISTVRHADQIIVMDKGRIVEIGTHAELVDDRKNYYELVRNQLELGG